MYVFVHHGEPGWGSSNVQSLLRLVTPQAVASSEPKATAEPKPAGEPNAKTEPMAAVPSGWSAPAPSSQKALPIRLVPLAAPSLRSHTQKPTRAQPIDARQRTVDAIAKPSPPVDSSNLERTFPPGEPSANAITSAPPNPPTDEMLDTRK
jgi:hypothetical protein